MSAPRFWLEVWQDYVHGFYDPSQQRHRFPSMDELAERHGIAVGTIRRRSKAASKRGEGSWGEQRQRHINTARSLIDTQQADRVAQARDAFDNHSLLTAFAALQKVAQGVAALQVTLLRPDGSRQLAEGAALEMRRLCSALVDAQRAGRLAQGFATEHVEWQGTSKLEVSEAADLLLSRIDVKSMPYDDLVALRRLIGGLLDGDPTGADRPRDLH